MATTICKYKGDEFRDKQLKINEANFYKKGKRARKARACAYCGGEYYAKNMCRKCYSRYRRYGHVGYSEKTMNRVLAQEIKEMSDRETPLQKAARKTFLIDYPNEIKPDVVRMLENRMKLLLSERDRGIYLMRADGKSLAAIADVYGLSRERIRQIVQNADYALLCGKKIYNVHGVKKEGYLFCGRAVSSRASTVLTRAKIETMQQLADYVTSGSLIDLECCGAKTAKELTQLFFENTVVVK